MGDFCLEPRGTQRQEEETREQQQAQQRRRGKPPPARRLAVEAAWLTQPDGQSQGVYPCDGDGNTHEE